MLLLAATELTDGSRITLTLTQGPGELYVLFLTGILIVLRRLLTDCLTLQQFLIKNSVTLSLF